MNYSSVANNFRHIIVTSDSRQEQRYMDHIAGCLTNLESNRITVARGINIEDVICLIKDIYGEGKIPVVFLDKYFTGGVLDIDIARAVMKECPEGGVIIPVGNNPQQQHIDITMARGTNNWMLPHVWGMDSESSEIEWLEVRDMLAKYHEWHSEEDSENKLS